MVNVVAHRGASAANPPGNTIAAFAEAVAQGADWVELDVHLTADGEIVVHHDPVLADGRVLGELSAADLPDVIPTLAEVLAACSPLAVNVEIKPDGVDALRSSLIAKVVELLQSEAPSRDFLVTSFDHDICDQVRALDATLPTGLLNAHGDSLQTDLDRAESAGHVAINPWFGLVTKEFGDRAHALGIAVNVWTVDEPEQMRALADMGVDAIITNVPSLCREVLSER
jgi:glycerophosphoryl diester phosphodiesterase